MTTHRYFAILHHPSGMTLPLPKLHRISTGVEPTDQEPPRLFKIHAHANSALQWWLRGKCYKEIGIEGDWLGTKVYPQPNRNPADMQVCEVILTHPGVKP